jgi:hypothetical protein
MDSREKLGNAGVSPASWDLYRVTLNGLLIATCCQLSSMTAQTSVIARAEGPRQFIGFHPRDDVSLPFLPA